MLITISLRSAITRGARVKAFSLVSGGVKGDTVLINFISPNYPDIAINVG